MRKWKIIGALSVLVLIVFVFSFGESDKPLLNQPFVVQNWSNKIITLVNGSASGDSLMVHDDTGNGVRRIAPMSTHLAPYALTSSIPTNNNQLTNGSGYITPNSSDVLTNKTGNISQWTNNSGYLTSVSNAQVLSALGFTPYNATNPSNFISRTGLSASNGVSYNSSTGNFTLTKRQETYSGTTNASGVYTVTFGASYSVAPNIQANIINGADNQNLRITSISTTGFTVLARTRVDIVGLLPTWNNASGLGIDVLITEK